ncbi:RHS repeat-associated core domain-containing protein, partial [Capnocytophaga canimorsus]|uniref:RHS repeat-associated core domain-containing protein n=1 Tax=Capnocytophaga canimorsus TaxID=28188 RepID=UPI001BB41468
YQGQYYDSEIDLCYNRFRYYDCNTGTYISKDPIGLLGGFALYGYVKDVNKFVDIFGLWSIMDEIPSFKGWQRHHIIPKSLGGYNTTGYIHEVIKLSGIDVDKISRNIIHLPMFEGIDDTRSLHNGGHSDYTKMVREFLDDIHMDGKNINAGVDFYRNKVFDLMDDLRKGLMSGEIKCKD